MQKHQKRGRSNFPFRLHMLLSRAEELGLDNILAWHPSGTKFIIYNQEEFVDKVLPTIFTQTKFASFRRQLNAYGFERELNPNKSEDSASFLIYSHKNFRKNDPPNVSRTIPRRRRNQALWERMSLGRGASSVPTTSIVSLFNADDEERKRRPTPSGTDFVMEKDSKHLNEVLSKANEFVVGRQDEMSDVVLDELAAVTADSSISDIDYGDADMILWDPKRESLSPLEHKNKVPL